MMRGSVLSLTARTAAFTAWAASMTVVGLRLLLAPGDFPEVRPITLAGGAVAVAGGQFLFMVTVADRLFPRANRAAVTMMETASFAAFACSLLLLGWILWTR